MEGSREIQNARVTSCISTDTGCVAQTGIQPFFYWAVDPTFTSSSFSLSLSFHFFSIHCRAMLDRMGQDQTIRPNDAEEGLMHHRVSYLLVATAVSKGYCWGRKGRRAHGGREGRALVASNKTWCLLSLLLWLHLRSSP